MPNIGVAVNCLFGMGNLESEIGFGVVGEYSLELVGIALISENK